eukprot:scaffold40467_cov139-Skeletonema_marinoi.AAC.3
MIATGDRMRLIVDEADCKFCRNPGDLLLSPVSTSVAVWAAVQSSCSPSSDDIVRVLLDTYNNDHVHQNEN